MFVARRSTRPHLVHLALIVVLVVAVIASTLATPSSTHAFSSNPAVVISQIYGAGGNSGAPYRNDYVELFNRSTNSVALNGWSVQYASATGTGNFAANPIVTLSGTLAPGQYYLVQLGSSGSTGALLPTPNASGTIAMSASAGKVALVNSTTGLACNGGSTPCSPAQQAQIIDMVGYGNANYFEGSAAAPTLSTTTAALRAGGGCTDTNNNSADFSSGTPAPRNTSSTLNPCSPAACSALDTPISQVQGSNDISPLNGTTVTIQGVVVGDYEGASPALRGFFLQETAQVDANGATSEGIFVFNNNNNSVSLGQVVQVRGTASENFGQTQVSATNIELCGSTTTVTPVAINLPFPAPVGSVAYLERFEGMLVQFPQTLYVTEHFQLGRFGQVVLSSGTRLTQPTHIAAPGAAAQAVQASNNLNRIVIDDELNNQNRDPILFARGGQPLSASNTLRGGDTVSGLVGVMTYTWSGNSASPETYRVRPVGALGGGVPNFQATNSRPASPDPVGGRLKIANFNLLNYFNTFTGCTLGVGGGTTDCRGAENQAEFDRQVPKTLAALLGMNADVLGLVELENDGYGANSAVQDLVNRLNNATAPGTYAFINVDANTGQVNALGTDAIKVGIIYKPSKVTPVGNTAVLNTGAFGTFQITGGSTQRNRPALAQTFAENATGARFTVVVNHLKSKGSSCSDNISPVGPDPDTGDGQGNCNLTRTAAAQELVNWLAGNPTGVADPDVLIIGDLNSYAMENPITTIKNAGYTDLLQQLLGSSTYSYVFDGQWGYLDHALASASLVPQVTGITEWHINADEPPILDYNTNFKSVNQQQSLYAANAYRSSDHDPVLVGLALNVPAASTVTTVAGNTQAHCQSNCFFGSATLALSSNAPIASTQSSINVRPF